MKYIVLTDILAVRFGDSVTFEEALNLVKTHFKFAGQPENLVKNDTSLFLEVNEEEEYLFNTLARGGRALDTAGVQSLAKIIIDRNNYREEARKNAPYDYGRDLHEEHANPNR